MNLNELVPPHSLPFDLNKQTIMLGLSGSRSYGTETPTSDTDYKGILIPPQRFFWSPFARFDQHQWKTEEKSGRVSEVDGKPEAAAEGTIYSLPKFIELAANCNPSIIEMLWLRDQDYLVMTPVGEKLIENRSLFLSKRAAYSFSGYAHSQLKRIQTHRRWLMDPQTTAPERSDFGLGPEMVISGDQLGAAAKLVERNLREIAPWLVEADNQHQEAFFEGLNKIVAVTESQANWLQTKAAIEDQIAIKLGFDSNFMEYLRKEKEFGEARFKYGQYQAWLRNRNPARADLEARYGYDCKHAMHLVRLIRMGREILTTGEINVYRPDREELLRIRNGAWPYDELVEWAEKEIAFVNGLVSSPDCVLPRAPNAQKIEDLCENLMDEFFNN